jgi:outer membrane protein OmpA-like peptidoglycan-associated protein
MVAVAAVQLLPAARADETRRLEPDPMVAAGIAVEFQASVGDRVFFSQGSADLGTRARLAIEAQAAWLLRNPTLPVVVEGHADDSASGEQDRELSQHRAEAVRRRLVLAGVVPERIRTVAYGRQRLVADCRSAACSAQNRRAVTVVGGAVASAVDDQPAPEPRSALNRRPPRRLF